MVWLRSVGAVVVSAAIVLASGIAAEANPGDGVCSITLQLPATVAPGAVFTLNLLEDDDCAGLVDPSTFSGGGLLDSRGNFVDDDIQYTHTLGAGDDAFRGYAPTEAEYYTPYVDGFSVVGADLTTSTMQVTAAVPAPDPSPTAAPTPIATPTPSAPPKPSEKKKYKNCTAVHTVWSGGIARPGVSKDKIKGKKSRPLRGDVLHSKVAYKANKKLDRDRDGAVCEVSGSQ